MLTGKSLAVEPQEILGLGAMASPMIGMKGPAMLKRAYEPQFPLKHAQKDMRFALQLGDQVSTPLPLAAAANASFISQRADHGDEDFSAVFEGQK